MKRQPKNMDPRDVAEYYSSITIPGMKDGILKYDQDIERLQNNISSTSNRNAIAEYNEELWRLRYYKKDYEARYQTILEYVKKYGSDER